MRRLLLAGLVFVALQTSARAADVDCETRPAWCHDGYACAPTVCVTSLRIELEEARQDLRQALRASRIFHFDAGCGPAIAGVVDQDLGTHVVPSPIACGAFAAIRLGGWHRPKSP